MNYYHSLLLILLSLPALLHAQSIQPVDYAITYDFISITDTVEEAYTRPLEFILLHRKTESRFHAVNEQFNDSMRTAYEANNPQIGNFQNPEEMQEAVNAYAADMVKWKKPIYADFNIRKDFSHHIFQSELTFAFPPQHLEEPLDLNWQLNDRQDTIAGFNCYQATTYHGGRNYTAWFSPDIPIPDGPYVFSGLPGLIVQISDERGWFTFRVKYIDLEPGERLWKENYLNPTSQAINRKSYVDQSIQQKNNPRIIGALDQRPEDLLTLKKSYQWRYFMLLESY